MVAIASRASRCRMQAKRRRTNAVARRLVVGAATLFRRLRNEKSPPVPRSSSVRRRLACALPQHGRRSPCQPPHSMPAFSGRLLPRLNQPSSERRAPRSPQLEGTCSARAQPTRRQLNAATAALGSLWPFGSPPRAPAAPDPRRGATNEVLRVVDGIRTRRLGGGDVAVSELGLGTQRWGSADANAPDEGA